MKKYTNFEVKDDTLVAEQEPSKTNHSALEAIRQEQLKQFPPALMNDNFNEWTAYVSQQVTLNKFGNGTQKNN